MTTNGVLQLLLYLVVLIALAKPLGAYMARVYQNRPFGLDRMLGWLERLIYRLGGVRPDEEMGWKTYAAAMLLFNLAGLLAVYLLQRLQGVLPLNPQGLGAVSPDSSFNTAVSFATNTNWQGYGGESTMSYLTQMLALTVQHFLSAATGMAVLVALIRGFARRSAQTIGNFWVDMTRSALYILLPLSFILALALVSQGMTQTFGPSVTATVVQPTQYDEPVTDKDGKPVVDDKGQPKTKKSTLTEQVIAVGPVASQIAIKQLGTNGGGYFNANSADPIENPTPISNFLEVLSILLIAAALCYTFGVMVGDTRQGWAVLAAMTVIFVGLLATCYLAELRGHTLVQQGVDHTTTALSSGGNMEGKEVRFGIANSALWATATTSASNGSVNSMHDSFTPIGGLVPMWLIQLGEVVYGGVGSGLYGMLMFAIIAVFVAGLMVGRTPEYLGKKITPREIKLVSLYILTMPVIVLATTAAAVALPGPRKSILNGGPHGLSEVLYAFMS
ncbi:MAG TPA: potassium-transporting ATPase subunit KdpA, partial [Methylomirabilota bacterium]|nr:potassium-transporting ATPase subunit KdpA [Methylomirabilota bacterium]